MGDKFLYLIILLPLLQGFLTEYYPIQKNFKYDISKGYAYIILIPVFISYASYSVLNDLTKTLFLFFPVNLIFTIIVVIIARILADKFFAWRRNRLHFKKFSEHWLMNRFYSDLAYSIMLSVPGIIYFFLTDFL